MVENVEDDAQSRAAAIRLVIMDVDGVLTDGSILYGPDGFEGVHFNVQDGTGIKYLHRAGIRTAIISGRDIEAVRRRASSLGIEEVVQGAKVKLNAYQELLDRLGVEDREVAYLGDDLPDLPVLRRVGLAVSVADGDHQVLEAAQLVTSAGGGQGAVRELAEFLLKVQDKWGEIMSRYRG